MKFSSNGHIDHDLEVMDSHEWLGNIETPLTAEDSHLSDEDKLILITSHFREIMKTLGLDLSDDSLRDTPGRVAKMYLKEIFYGLSSKNKPKISLFENAYRYNKLLVERNITVKSTCEHHFLPIIGKAHVGYISSGKVIGLSKLNRIVDYYSRRPQVQERLTKQIHQDLKTILDTDDVIVIIDAEHFCVKARGIEHENSSTVTLEYSGQFENAISRKEFMDLVQGNS